MGVRVPLSCNLLDCEREWRACRGVLAHGATLARRNRANAQQAAAAALASKKLADVAAFVLRMVYGSFATATITIRGNYTIIRLRIQATSPRARSHRTGGPLVQWACYPAWRDDDEFARRNLASVRAGQRPNRAAATSNGRRLLACARALPLARATHPLTFNLVDD